MQEIQFQELMCGSTERMPTQIFNLHKYSTVCNNAYSKTSAAALDETHTPHGITIIILYIDFHAVLLVLEWLNVVLF